MSYKVIIVDDEPMIRHGLSTCINWEKEGFHLVGEAINGQAALDNFLVQDIDILITDIKMPLLDGLELTRRWKQFNADIKVILISSYSDFNYAREAVQLGVVSDYLLKPTMEPSDLLNILLKCKAELDRDAEEKSRHHFYVIEAEKNKQNELERNLRRILRGDAVEAYNFPTWMKGPLVLAIWEQDNQVEHQLEQLLQLETAKEKLNSWFEQCAILSNNDHELVLLIPDHMNTAHSKLKKYHHKMLFEHNQSFSIGVSPTFHHISSLASAYKWSATALQQSFYGGKGKYYMGKIPVEHVESNSELPITNWPTLRSRFSKKIGLSNKEASQSILKEYFASWKSEQYSQKDIMDEAKHILSMIWSRKQTLSTEKLMANMSDQLPKLSQITTLTGLIDYISHEFNTFWDEQFVSILPNDAKGAHVIQLAISYIQENFRRELSLQEVAEHVYMSKNYFSEQFKYFTGVNFIDFVIKLRIHHAKQLLSQTALRIQDVGAESGFQSPKYFLKLFKREVSCTPMEYRQKYYDESTKKGVNE